MVIGGDDNYKGRDEEDSRVLSRWARRKIMSQFTEDFLDGSTSFVFSWGEKHRPIHEEALLHLLLHGNQGKKFVPRPVVPEPVVPQPKSFGSETDPVENENDPELPDVAARDDTGNASGSQSGEAREPEPEPVRMEIPAERGGNEQEKLLATSGGTDQKEFTFKATLEYGQVTKMERSVPIPEYMAESWKKRWGNSPEVTAEIQVINNEVNAVVFTDHRSLWWARLLRWCVIL